MRYHHLTLRLVLFNHKCLFRLDRDRSRLARDEKANITASCFFQGRKLADTANPKLRRCASFGCVRDIRDPLLTPAHEKFNYFRAWKTTKTDESNRTWDWNDSLRLTRTRAEASALSQASSQPLENEQKNIFL